MREARVLDNGACTEKGNIIGTIPQTAPAELGSPPHRRLHSSVIAAS